MLVIVGIAFFNEDLTSELDEFLDVQEDTWRSQELCEEISDNSLLGARERLDLLLLACRDDDWRRRLIGCKELDAYLGAVENDETYCERVVETLVSMLDDTEPLVRFYASWRLTTLAPHRVFERIDLFKEFLNFIYDANDPDDTAYLVGRIFPRFLEWHRGKKVSEILPLPKIKQSTDRIVCDASIDNFYKARGQVTPEILWASNPFEGWRLCEAGSPQ